MIHTIFRIVFTTLPLVVIVAMFTKSFNDNGVDGLIMVAKAVTGMAVGVGFLFLIAYLYREKDKLEEGNQHSE